MIAIAVIAVGIVLLSGWNTWALICIAKAMDDLHELTVRHDKRMFPCIDGDCAMCQMIESREWKKGQAK